MYPPSDGAMERIAQLYKALSEQPRLQILSLLLRHGELCVCELEGALGATQSKTSRHVRYLASAGLVQDRRDGVRVLYRLPDEPDAEVAAVLDGFRRLAVEQAGTADGEEPVSAGPACRTRGRAPAPGASA